MRPILPILALGLGLFPRGSMADEPGGEPPADSLALFDVNPERISASTVRRLGHLDSDKARSDLVNLASDQRFPAEDPMIGRALVESLAQQLKRTPLAQTRTRERFILALIEFAEPSRKPDAEEVIPLRTRGTALRALGETRSSAGLRVVAGIAESEVNAPLKELARETLREFAPNASPKRKEAPLSDEIHSFAPRLFTHEMLSALRTPSNKLEADSEAALRKRALHALAHPEFRTQVLSDAKKLLTKQDQSQRDAAAFAIALLEPKTAADWFSSTDNTLRPSAVGVIAQSPWRERLGEEAPFHLALTLTLEIDGAEAVLSTRALRSLEREAGLLPLVHGLLAKRLSQNGEGLAPSPHEIGVWLRSSGDVERSAIAFGLGLAEAPLADGLIVSGYEREEIPEVRRAFVHALRKRGQRAFAPKLFAERLERIARLDPDSECRQIAASPKTVSPEETPSAVFFGKFLRGDEKPEAQKLFVIVTTAEGRPWPIFLDRQGYGFVSGLEVAAFGPPVSVLPQKP